MSKKKNIKNYYRSISINEFIKNYIESTSYFNKLENLSELINHTFNHYDLDDLMLPGIVPISLNHISISELETGRIILVSANGSHGKGREIRAYLRPDLALMKKLIKDSNYNIEYLTEEEKMNYTILSSLYPDDFSEVKALKKKHN